MRALPRGLAALALLVAGCSSSGGSPSTSCRAGAVEACACASGGSGTQACGSDGRWGACGCGAVDAGDGCTGGTTLCDGRCVDLSSDPTHCGDCATACATGQVCTAGACACDGTATLCGDACADLSSDTAHCGACDTACVGDQICAAGQCTCPTGESLCDTTCTDLSSAHDHCGDCATACDPNADCVSGKCVWRGTHVQHVVLVVQENHTFDAYFGAYCRAPAHSSPACTTGPGCCEAAPPVDPAGNAPYELTDSFNFGADHDHGFPCEVCEIDGGRMDRFTAGGCSNDFGLLGGITTIGCSSAKNYAIATDPTLMQTYWGWADRYALADRYFQPIAGSTSSNDMYFAVSHYEFLDNALFPKARGVGCTDPTSSPTTGQLAGRTTIADVLLGGGFSFKAYADGYADAYNAAPGCPSAGGDCPESLLTSACKYDPSDIPFEYYPQFTDDTTYMRDLSDFFSDVQSGSLPSFSYVKYRTSANEHPEWSYISHGENNVAQVVDAVLGSATYANDTLVLVAWDEGGGFFDHVAPPASVEQFPTGASMAGQDVPYGTRVPLLALGRFARVGEVSHETMEHSSIVAFLEWNFLGPDGVGAIRATDPEARDGVVGGIGSLLDATQVGATPP